MLITLQSYNRLIPKNCENRHFDVEAEVVPFCPMSHRWDKWDKVGQVGQVGQSVTNGTSGTSGKWLLARRQEKRGAAIWPPRSWYFV